VRTAARQHQQASVPTISFFASSVPGLDPGTATQLEQQQQSSMQQQGQQQGQQAQLVGESQGPHAMDMDTDNGACAEGFQQQQQQQQGEQGQQQQQQHAGQQQQPEQEQVEQQEMEQQQREQQMEQQQQRLALRRLWELLQQRPVWSAQMLQEQMGPMPQLQHALPRLCYKFKTGVCSVCSVCVCVCVCWPSHVADSRLWSFPRSILRCK